MLVSHSRKLVFVHIQKTGGQTVSKVLKKNISDVSRLKPKHAFAVQGMEDLEGWNEYFKFAFVRNPWDRMVSWYSMIRNSHLTPLDQIPVDQREKIRHLRQVRSTKQRGNRVWRYVLDNSSTFEEFITNCTDMVKVKESVDHSFTFDQLIHYSPTFNQLDHLSDGDGNLLVDFIGRFENFENDLLQVSNRLGVELRSVPHGNRSPHRHYSSFYTPETEMIVRERFQRDIEYFGYEFEDAERSA